jgi:hypothetical protein
MKLILRRRIASAGLLVLCSFRQFASATQRFLGEQPNVKYSKLPGIPSDEMVVEQNEAAKTAADWSNTAQVSSALRVATAENMEQTVESQVISEERGLALRGATQVALLAAQRTGEMRKRALAAAKRAEKLVSEMPQIALQAAQRAINEAVAGAVGKMNIEATKVAKKQAEIEKKLQKKAAEAAQVAALPWQQAKMRSSQTMVSYMSQARDLANAVTQLRLKAPTLSQTAGILQSRGDVVHAQQYQIAAKDLLDKADQMASQAQAFDKMGKKIDSGLAMYDLSATAAASYASYTSNPGGGVGASGLPPLPFPLHLVEG